MRTTWIWSERPQGGCSVLRDVHGPVVEVNVMVNLVGLKFHILQFIVLNGRLTAQKGGAEPRMFLDPKAPRRSPKPRTTSMAKRSLQYDEHPQVAVLYKRPSLKTTIARPNWKRRLKTMTLLRLKQDSPCQRMFWTAPSRNYLLLYLQMEPPNLLNLNVQLLLHLKMKPPNRAPLDKKLLAVTINLYHQRNRRRQRHQVTWLV